MAIISLKENERGILLKNGKFWGILKPGRHFFLNFFSRKYFETYNLAYPKISSNLLSSIYKKYENYLEKDILIVRPKENTVAFVYCNSKLIDIVSFGDIQFYWKDSGEMKVEYLNTEEDVFLPIHKNSDVKLLANLYPNILHLINVPDEHVGLLYIENKLHSTLDEGVYYAWVLGRNITSTVIDLRLCQVEVLGQEIITKDKVTIRINATCYYKIKDPMKLVSSLQNFQDYLYKQIQFALRKSIESRLLDEVFDSKETLDSEIDTHVKKIIGDYGIEIDSISIKDIILPGDMREILNHVILAEKEAQANLIKRREEVAATRSLLNTAKLMDDHPMLLKLKEIESIENILQKVEHLSVYGGGIENLVSSLLGSNAKSVKK